MAMPGLTDLPAAASFMTPNFVAHVSLYVTRCFCLAAQTEWETEYPGLATVACRKYSR